MSQRFYSETPIVGPDASLTGSEAHHLIHVMRAKVGDVILLFDGGGSEFQARVRRLGRSQVDLDVMDRQAVDRELPFALALGVALPKGDRQRWLIEKATELGVTRVVPLQTERGVAQPVNQALTRLHRTVIESSKQCGRNLLMEVASPMTLENFVQTADARARRLFTHLGAAPLAPIQPAPSAPCDVIIAVGPEGGFSDEEVAVAAQVGWQIVGLGPRVLRVETAAVAMCAQLAGGWF